MFVTVMVSFGVLAIIYSVTQEGDHKLEKTPYDRDTNTDDTFMLTRQSKQIRGHVYM